ncbi:hypothetical protein CEQ90_06605 [Lewinellaceae bacterium SD302]|nr:hypothetical protein CEQ90_06605 [Lewinellaceae bacterium SD302]
MKKLIRLWFTIRHLRLRQIVFQCYYRFLFRTDKVAKLVKKAERGHLVPLTKDFTPSLSQLSPNQQFFPPARFTFLNLTVDFEQLHRIDWNYAEHGKLWTYNLNYFEFLRSPEISFNQGSDLILSWIEKAEGHRDGWEPYPMSLRIVNWLQFHREHGREIRPLFDLALRRQYLDLWTKLEYHLDGNHLLENAIALLMAALYFDDRAGIQRAANLFVAQQKSQYLADGGHYERSPMYHCILLWRQLDLWSWLITAAPATRKLCYNTCGDPRKLLGVEAIKIQLSLQLSWLNNMVDENGHYPHFNDSTDGIAPMPAQLFNYANALGLVPSDLPLSDSGYRHLQSGELDLWIDAAPIGPDHIPGHAHADSLTFCLSYAGQPLIVDTSISTYEKNQRRHFERSTIAHNTVVIGGQNSSEVWGGFRVGARAKTRIESEEVSQLTASHHGYRDIHRRYFELTDNELRIIDKTGNAPGVAHFHLASGLKARVENGSVVVVTEQTTSASAENLLVFSFGNAESSIRLDCYELATGFNQLVNCVVIVVQFQSELTTKIKINIQ